MIKAIKTNIGLWL